MTCLDGQFLSSNMIANRKCFALGLKESAAITTATVLRKLTCSITCRPKLDFVHNKNINMAI